MAEAQAQSVVTESPWFWKVFGGAIISVITVLVALVGNTVMTNMSNTRTELMTLVTALKEEQVNMREKLAALMQAKESGMARFTDLEKAVRTLEDNCKSQKEHMAVIDSAIKERAAVVELNINNLKAANEKFAKDIQEVRERMLRLDEKVKKDVK